jgi:hypothetical protein
LLESLIELYELLLLDWLLILNDESEDELFDEGEEDELLETLEILWLLDSLD